MNLDKKRGLKDEPVKILVVDDQEESLFAITELLSNPEYEIVKAKDGEQAMRRLLEKEFAVILLDVKLPGIDGFEIATLIREHEKLQHTPIIFITGVEKELEDIKKGYSLGAVDYLLKPVIPEFLKAKVAVFVELFRKKREEVLAREEISLLASELKQSNEELERFADVASHDLKEPLRMINNFSELLEHKYSNKLDERGLKHLKFIRNGSEKMLSMVHSVLSYSKIQKEELSLEKIEITNLLEDLLKSIELIIKESKAKIDFKNMPVVYGDPIQIGRVFQNLILNAIKFKGENLPVIKISAELFKEDKAGNKKWLFTIKDNGIGIDSKHQKKIFIVFKKLHSNQEYPGIGIGLAECKKIIESHNGTIGVESEGKGMGASFYFTLPFCQK